MKKYLFTSFLLTIAVALAVFVKPVDASVSTCTASVSPTSITNYSSNSFTFTINNTDSVIYHWIKITRPSSLFVITGGSVSGWSMSTNESEITLANGNVSNGGLQNVGASVNVPGSDTATSANWTIQVSDNADGSNPFTCTGTLGTEITGGGTDTFEPVVSDITISSVTDTSVTIGWTTDEASTSGIWYGTTNSYGSESSSSTLTTSHSVTLESLGSDITYHFQIFSADASGNTAYSDDYTFNTSSEQATVTVTNTVTNTETVTETKTVTKLIEDTEKPTISFTTDFDKPFNAVPQVSGKVTDNAGTANIEYSSDGGENWLPVEETTGLRSKTVNFTFFLFGLLDGDYKIKVRATDLSGNVGISDTKTLVFDRLPPSVGGILYSLGAQVITPDSNGEIVTVSKTKQKITLSAVGGATSIKILAKATSLANLQTPQVEISLSENKNTGLWSGDMSFDNPGKYALTAVSIDGAGNETEKEIGTVSVLTPGRLIGSDQDKDWDKYEIKIYYFETTTGKFVEWDAEAYGLNNPVKVGNNGNYNIILPAGKYYLQVKKGDFKLNTRIFEVKGTTPITSSLSLKELRTIEFGSIRFVLPQIFQGLLDIDIQKVQAENAKDALVGQEMPEFELKNDTAVYDQFYFRGKPTVYTFINTWTPTVSEQITILDQLSDDLVANIVVVIPQEQITKVDVYQKLGGYKPLILADPDGLFFDKFRFTSLPTTILVDNRGVIINVIRGVAGSDEIVQKLLSY